MADYQIVVRDPFFTTLMTLDGFATLDYARTVNAVGALTLTLADDWDARQNLSTFDKLNRRDNLIEVWRAVEGRAVVDMETAWLVRHVERSLDSNGRRMVTVRAWDAVQLIERRHVLYASGEADAQCDTYADDALKDVFENNLGTGAIAARDWSAALGMQIRLALAPNVRKDFAWRNCLTVMQEIAAASAAATSPRYLAFDLVYLGPGEFEFRTYVDWRGIDHRWPSGRDPVLLDPDAGNLADVRLAFDYAGEYTHVTAGGQGQGAARTIEEADNPERAGQSRFGRIERFVDARNSTDAGVQAEADAALRAGMPRVSFAGRLVETPGTRYGKHFSLGDIVTANYINASFAVRLNSIRVRVADGVETVEAALRADEILGQAAVEPGS